MSQIFETDVLVIGSGAGALTAAITAHDRGAKVMVIEKTDQYGGTSAMSGGVAWFPNSPLNAATDSAAEGKEYMKAVIQAPEMNAHIDTYVDTIPEMLDYLHEKTPLRFDVIQNFPDMYPDMPGFKMIRCHEARPFHGKLLGGNLGRQRPQHPQTGLYGVIGWTATESLILQARGPGWLGVAMKMVMRYIFDIPGRLKGMRDRRQVLGGALVGSLRLGMMQRGMEDVHLNTAAGEFIVEDGRVTGVYAQKDGREIQIYASKGIILASGGFEKNQAMREKYLGTPTDTAWTAASPGNTGEMIENCEKIGADLGFMDAGWWGPTVCIPGEPQARMLIIEKNLPGGILVNKAGKRFVNESSSYTKVNNGMKAANKPGAETIPAYLIIDADYRAKYPLGPALPSSFQPDYMLSEATKRELKKADSIRGLAEQLGIDAGGLEAEVERFNAFAMQGKDEDFQRGDALYDQYYGDAESSPTDNPCLGPIRKAPFYGIKVYPGELGTKGGVATTPDGAVLNKQGEVIPGLYATGNCSRPVTGQTYPASGATLGPAMVFGYRAARHVCGD